jgi:hypothetical protein
MHGLVELIEDGMPPKPGYKQPGREGKVSMLIWVDPDIRSDFKIATIENGTNMQDAIEQFVIQYAAEVTKRRRRKG